MPREPPRLVGQPLFLPVWMITMELAHELDHAWPRRLVRPAMRSRIAFRSNGRVLVGWMHCQDRIGQDCRDARSPRCESIRELDLRDDQGLDFSSAVLGIVPERDRCQRRHRPVMLVMRRDTLK